MKIRIARKNRGFAVIIALVAVIVLTLMAGAFAYSMKVETKLAANTNEDEQFYWLGRGGVDRACWWLSLEAGGGFSSLKQYWNHGEGDGPETNGPLVGESLDNFQIGQGAVSLSIKELDGKININNPANWPLLPQILTTMGADAGDIPAVSDSIQDWISPGDNARPGGAKSDYYLGLTPPYYAKDAPIDNLDELMLIKGVTREMYYGGSSSPSPSPFPEHQLGFGHAPGQQPDYLFGLRDIFTPYSSGSINLLTADDKVMQCLPGLDTASVQAIETARDSDPPIHDIGHLLAAAGLNATVFNQMGSQTANLGVLGNTYEVHATATIGQLSHEYTAILVRNGPNVTVCSFYRSDTADHSEPSK